MGITHDTERIDAELNIVRTALPRVEEDLNAVIQPRLAVAVVGLEFELGPGLMGAAERDV